jgi:hypothetical protein
MDLLKRMTPEDVITLFAVLRDDFHPLQFARLLHMVSEMLTKTIQATDPSTRAPWSGSEKFYAYGSRIGVDREPMKRRLRSRRLGGPVVSTTVRQIADDREAMVRAARRKGVSHTEFVRRSIRDRARRILSEPAA